MYKSLLDATSESMKAMMKTKGEINVSPEQSMDLALWNIAFALADIADSLRGPEDEAKAVHYEYADGEMVYDIAFCSNCEHEFEEDSENWKCGFCPSCGQKLRWED